MREPDAASCPGVPVSNSRGQLAPDGAVGGGDLVAGPGTTQDVAARDDAHLQSLGIKPELRRSPRLHVELRGRVQLHQRLDRHVHAHRRRPGRRRTVVLLVLAASSSSARPSSPSTSPSWPATSRSQGPSTSGRSACRQQDARLVHGLDLLLGRRPDDDGRRDHRPARHGEHLGLRSRVAVADPGRTMSVFIALLTLRLDDAHQRLRGPAAIDHQQPRRRRRDPRDGRLRPDPPDLLQPSAGLGPDRQRART